MDVYVNLQKHIDMKESTVISSKLQKMQELDTYYVKEEREGELGTSNLSYNPCETINFKL